MDKCIFILEFQPRTLANYFDSGSVRNNVFIDQSNNLSALAIEEHVTKILYGTQNE